MDTSRVFGLSLLGNEGPQLLVDSIGDEGSERCETTAQREEDFKQSVECMLSILNTVLTLETPSVQLDVPICGILNEAKEPRDDGV